MRGDNESDCLSVSRIVTFSLSTKGGGSLSMLLFLASLLRAAGDRDLLAAVTGDFDRLIVTGDLDLLIVTGDFDFLTVFTGDLDFLSLGLRSAMPQ